MNNEKQIDIDLLQGYLDNLGGDIVRQMFDLYVQQSSIYLEDIAAAVNDNSQQAWQESCHKMKGAAGSAGLLTVHGKLVDIEKLTSPSDEKAILLAQLRALNESALTAADLWLARKITT